MENKSKKQTKIKAKKYESNTFEENTTSKNHVFGENKMSMEKVISIAWGAKEDMRGPFKKHQWGGIILPFLVLRRLGRVLEPTKDKVIQEFEKIKDLDDDLIEARLNKITGYPFHNTTDFDLDKILRDETRVHSHMKSYVRGFSKNVRDIFANFNFENKIDELHKHKKLIPLVQRFSGVILDPETYDNHMMGMIYEEIILRSSQAGNEEAGEHFTPREVIRLITNLLFAHDEEILKRKNLIRTIYDPAVGTGGMLSIASEYLKNTLNSDTTLVIHGQELNPESYAICKSDIMLKINKSNSVSEGLDLDNIVFGNSLTDEDGFKDKTFHYMISNPPYGVDWSSYKKPIDEEKKIDGSRYSHGTPGYADGSFLFLLNMISKMKPKKEGGSRIGIVFNGSPLLTGEAGSGESNIRKWLFKEDLIETIIGLPKNLFYNTDINTYIWILTNNKSEERKGKIQLIDASSKYFYKQMRKSYNKKRHEIHDDGIKEITNIFKKFKPGKFSKILENDDFEYTRITVERPLKRNFQVNEKRIKKFLEDQAERRLNTKKKLREAAKKVVLKNTHYLIGEDLEKAIDIQLEKTISENVSKVKKKQKEVTDQEILNVLKKIPTKLYKDYGEFLKDLRSSFKSEDVHQTTGLLNKIINSLSEKDETAKKYFKKKDDPFPVPDSELRDFENIPKKQNIQEYFNTEVVPYVSELSKPWIDPFTLDNIGYEIPFMKYFYKFEPLRPLEDVNTEIKQLQKDIIQGFDKLMK